MKNRKRRAARAAAATALASVLLIGCASELVTVAPAPPAQYERLGRAEGKACGMLGFLATAYHFAPIGLNSRVERAYRGAVASVPGATALVDVTMSEDWTYGLIGTFRCVTISGEAIR